MAFIAIATPIIRGELTIIPIIEITISLKRFIKAFNLLSSGTFLRLITGKEPNLLTYILEEKEPNIFGIIDVLIPKRSQIL